MGYIYGELRELTGEATLSWDIAHHLYVRHMQGVAMIVAEKPSSLLAAVRKQWLKVIGQLLKERSRTLKSERIAEINYEIERMRSLKFIAKNPPLPDADVFLVAPEWIEADLPESYTIYITCQVSRATLQTLIGRISYHGLVVVYDDVMAQLVIESKGDA
jgi:hypothetical protein